jgi:hypothetical protein
MKKPVILFSLCLISTFLFAQTKPNHTQIIIKNLSALDLKDKPVTIKRSDLKGIPSGNLYPLLLLKGDTIPSQLDEMNGDQQWDELFFVVNLPARQQTSFTLKWVSEKPEYIKRTSVRFGKRMAATTPVAPAMEETLTANELPKSIGFQRYQTDGPSWENDKVGFRHYLDGRNSKDVFGKLVTYMSPDKVGINAKGEVEDNYHVMEKWGRDILAVGNSVGIGGIGLLKENTAFRLGVTAADAVNNVEKTSFHIVAEGPVRSVLNFNYTNWKPGADTYQVNETTSIWPGMYAYHNSVSITGIKQDENLALGIVSINAVKQPTVIKVNKDWVAVISHEKHAYNKEWWIGLALIVPAKSYLDFIEAPKKGQLSTSFLVRLKLKNNQPINYFAVAGWELSDPGFKDDAYFQKYLLSLTNQIAAPIKVTLK